MSLPIVCFDLDGTLLDENGRIHPRDVAILAAETAACLVPSTGRPLHAVRRLFARHGLFCDRPIPFPLVLQNGTLLYRPGEQLYRYTPYPRDVQAALFAVAKATPQVTFLWLDQTSIHALWPRPAAEAAAASYDFFIQPFTSASQDASFSKLMCMSEDPQALDQLHRSTAHLSVECAYSMATILEFTPLGANKGQGLRQLQAALGLGASPIYAAGDGGNDLALFELARESFAPLRSPEAVRSAASHVVDVSAGGVLAPMLAAAGLANSATA
jgi:HAD superfamily hydrolase (TIGR01484 family)